MKIYKMITNEEIDKIWGSASFGGHPDNRLDIIMNVVLKMNAGWHTGHTAFTLCVCLGLVNKNKRVTPKGKMLVHEYFKTDNV